MDVTCDQCGAEYEFDETLLGDKGATVKCSNCNHVFRVLGRKEPGRPQLKLRFVSSGRVETLSSLRDLQVRVKNGEVTADDELGRDGNAFRRLGDVPELAVFFAPPTSRGAFGPAGADQGSPGGVAAPFDPFRNAPLQVSETSMPPTTPPTTPRDAPKAPSRDADAAKRTMIGVGPLNPHIPRPPRVPHVPGALPSSIPAPKHTGAAASAPGRGPLPAPISTIPTTPNTPRPTSVQAPRPAPSSQAPTTHGTAPLAGGQPLPSSPQQPAGNAFPGDGPVIARPLGNTPRSLAGVTAGPSPAAPAPKPVKLYLSDDEAPPARATQSGSKIWLYAGVAVLLGGAGFVGLSFSKKHAAQPDAAAEASPAEGKASAPATAAGEATPTPPVEEKAPAVTAPNAQAPAQAVPPKEAEPAAQASPAPTEPEKKAPSSSSTASSKSGTASSKSSSTSGSGSASSGSSSSGSASSAARDPSDYGGWVARGDQLFSRGDLSGAQAAYASALELRATGSEAHSGLGFMLLANGKPRDAIPHFDRAASSGFAEANIGLGDAYKKLGQKSNAIEAYQNYLDRLPSGSKASYARAQIESLKGGSSGSGSGTSSAEEPASPAPNNDYKPAGELSGASNENDL